MRVKNTQEQKQIHNVFLSVIYLFFSGIISIIISLYYFVFIKDVTLANIPKSYKIFDYIFKQWPKYFISAPSGYKITKFFGDFIHHIFLKK